VTQPSYYAYAPALDPATGDWLAGTDRPGGAPAVQIVLWTLRTQRGSFAPDETFGLDYRVAQKRTSSTQADWKAEVERALARHVTRGVITSLVVTVDPPTRDRLLFDVAFTDPRTAERVTTLRRLAA
jgi:phage gp46-like protein